MGNIVCYTQTHGSPSQLLPCLYSRRYFNRHVSIPAFNNLTPIRMHKYTECTHRALLSTKAKCIYYSYLKFCVCQKKAQNIHLGKSDACTSLNVTIQDTLT